MSNSVSGKPRPA